MTFNTTGSIVNWIAPTTGTYRVTGVGAQGYSAAAGFVGGRGAKIAGTFSFTAGQSFQVAVGAAGPAGGPDNFNGGGGGTFFVSALGNPLLVAGGGGTRRDAFQNGTDASITAYAYNASGSSSSYTPTLKTSDLGLGGIASNSSWGSAGAGFYGNGQGDAPYGSGGASWANGLGGGTFNPSNGSICQGPGGFGGGGAGAGCGGGGDGGWVAGGGGSWNLGSDPFALAGFGYGDGLLTIDFLSAVPETGTWAMLIAGFGIVGAAARRRRNALA